MPPDGVETAVARGLLPDDGPARGRRGERRPGRAAGRRAGRQPELLLAATEDRLHQDYREPAMPRVAGAGPRAACRRPARGGLGRRADGPGAHRRQPAGRGRRACPGGLAGARGADRPARRPGRPSRGGGAGLSRNNGGTTGVCLDGDLAVLARSVVLGCRCAGWVGVRSDVPRGHAGRTLLAPTSQRRLLVRTPRAPGRRGHDATPH